MKGLPIKPREVSTPAPVIDLMAALKSSLVQEPAAAKGAKTNTQAAELLQTSDRIIKSFPDVASVFGKAGRAATATDPAAVEMFETDGGREASGGLDAALRRFRPRAI